MGLYDYLQVISPLHPCKHYRNSSQNSTKTLPNSVVFGQNNHKSLLVGETQIPWILTWTDKSLMSPMPAELCSILLPFTLDSPDFQEQNTVWKLQCASKEDCLCSYPWCSTGLQVQTMTDRCVKTEKKSLRETYLFPDFNTPGQSLYEVSITVGFFVLESYMCTPPPHSTVEEGLWDPLGKCLKHTETLICLAQ